MLSAVVDQVHFVKTHHTIAAAIIDRVRTR